MDEVKEMGEEESTINQTSGFVKELRPFTNEAPNETLKQDKENGHGMNEQMAKETPNKNTKGQEFRSGFV